MDILRAFLKAKPDAIFPNGANPISLIELNGRCSNGSVSQSEIDAAWILCQEEDRVNNIVEQLSNTDKNMIRVIEDIITVLIQKNLISLSDFSQSVQDKIAERQILRSQI